MSPTSSRRFSQAAADRAVGFFEKGLHHTKGRWARSPFKLESWQRRDIIEPLFGTQRWDAKASQWVRQYRLAWIELARKNGKSELLAGIALLLLCADDEEGGEIYGAARDRDQATLVFQVAKRMVELSPHLRKRLTVKAANKRIIDPQTDSYYQVISADAAGNLGQNPHGIVFDEVIAQPNGELWNALRTGMGSRTQPLMIAATTAGNNTSSFAAKQHREMERVMENPSRAPHIFAYIRNTPMGADPWDEKNWRHANPALGKFLSQQSLKDEALEAKNDPTLENVFRQFRLNQWVQQVTRWIPLNLWDENAQGLFTDESDLEGRVCYGGLDLASTTDLAALAWLFPGEPNRVVWRCWTPEAMVPVISARVPEFAEWCRAGIVQLTPGDLIHFDAIHEQIARDAEHFDVAEIGLDRWNSAATTAWMEQNGLPHTLVGQGYALSEASKTMMRLLKSRSLAHGGNPVARWNADSVEVKRDPQENLQLVKPNREGSSARIDLVLALVMAVDGWMRRPQLVSAYEDHGLEVV